MKNFILVGLLFSFWFSALQAQAEDTVIYVPESHVRMADLYPVKPKETRYFEVTASTWSPTGLSDSSYLKQTSNFDTVTLPQISINTLTSGWQAEYAQILPKFGLAVAQVQRSGNIGIANQYQTIHQTMNLYSLRVGIEAQTKSDLLTNLKPNLGLALLPTWASASQSEFNSGISRTYMGAELSAGFNWNIPAVASALGVQSFSADIGFEMTQGLGADFSGAGVLAGTRISL